jgi:hypothetical protein
MKSPTINAPALSLIGLQGDDSVTRLRHEIKFEYRNADVRKLHAILQVNNRHIVQADEESVVNSVYFDDHRLSLLHDNIAGVGRRYKLRLRWYDTTLPRRRVFFEVKRRIDKVVTKDRYAIDASRPVCDMQFSEIINELLRILPETPRELLRSHQQPVVLTCYRRRYFVARDSQLPIRITLDYDIAGYDQIGARYVLARFGMPLHDQVVLEVKCSVGAEKNVRRAIYPLSPRLSRFSKYALSCRQLQLTAGFDGAFA